MTVVDSSAVVDLLLDEGVAAEVQVIISGATPAVAPDVLVFEVMSAIRREAVRRVPAENAKAAVRDLGRLTIDLFPSMRLRTRAWELRQNLSVADAMFVALAELLGEPLVTKDAGLARAAAEHTSIEVRLLTSGAN